MDGLLSVAYMNDKDVERVTVQKFEPQIEWDFAEPSRQLAAALNAGRPVVYVRVDADLSWRTL
jgi:crossover junction endodeoxyribonuclease RusA